MRCHFCSIVVLSVLVCLAAANLADIRAAGATFDTQPWLEDLEQTRTAFATKYPDLEWEVFERGLDLSALFSQTRIKIQRANDIGDAKDAFDALMKRIGDKHVEIRWSSPNTAPVSDGVSCANLGYDTGFAGSARMRHVASTGHAEY